MTTLTSVVHFGSVSPRIKMNTTQRKIVFWALQLMGLLAMIFISSTFAYYPGSGVSALLAWAVCVALAFYIRAGGRKKEEGA